MNVKKTAVEWKVSESTVRRYCKDGLVVGAVYDEKNRRYDIPDESLCPLKFSEKDANTQNKRLIFVLRALNEQKTISSIALNCTDVTMQEYFALLLESKLIKRKKKNENDIFKNYILTIAGIEFLKKNTGLKKLAENLSPIIAAAAEGMTTAMLKHNQ